MSFEFTLLDALQALRCPVLDALAVFFDQAGARGEIWIAFPAVLPAFPRPPPARPGLAPAPGAFILFLFYTSPSPRERQKNRMSSSAFKKKKRDRCN